MRIRQFLPVIKIFCNQYCFKKSFNANRQLAEIKASAKAFSNSFYLKIRLRHKSIRNRTVAAQAELHD